MIPSSLLGRTLVLTTIARGLIAALATVLATACAGVGPRPVGAATSGVFSGMEGSRAFGIFRPTKSPREGDARALVVVLHGCAQSAEDIARGTRMNESAARVRGDAHQCGHRRRHAGRGRGGWNRGDDAVAALASRALCKNGRPLEVGRSWLCARPEQSTWR